MELSVDRGVPKLIMYKRLVEKYWRLQRSSGQFQDSSQGKAALGDDDDDALSSPHLTGKVQTEGGDCAFN